MIVDATSYLASDVHWQPDRGDTEAALGAFGPFLRDLAATARRVGGIQLYILGDLFDFWFEQDGETFSFYAPHLRLLRGAADAGVAIHLLDGNRDFTYGEGIRSACGAQLLGDRAEIRCGERRVLLQHGDLLCTGDWRYQLYRRAVRSPVARALMRRIPLSRAEEIIVRMQDQSKREIQRKSNDSMDVVSSEVLAEHRRGFDTVVCGHIHRPQRRQLSGAPAGAELITLGAWSRSDGWYVACGDDIELCAYHP